MNTINKTEQETLKNFFIQYKDAGHDFETEIEAKDTHEAESLFYNQFEGSGADIWDVVIKEYNCKNDDDIAERIYESFFISKLNADDLNVSNPEIKALENRKSLIEKKLQKIAHLKGEKNIASRKILENEIGKLEDSITYERTQDLVSLHQLDEQIEKLQTEYSKIVCQDKEAALKNRITEKIETEKSRKYQKILQIIFYSKFNFIKKLEALPISYKSNPKLFDTKMVNHKDWDKFVKEKSSQLSLLTFEKERYFYPKLWAKVPDSILKYFKNNPATPVIKLDGKNPLVGIAFNEHSFNVFQKAEQALINTINTNFEIVDSPLKTKAKQKRPSLLVSAESILISSRKFRIKKIHLFNPKEEKYYVLQKKLLFVGFRDVTKPRFVTQDKDQALKKFDEVVNNIKSIKIRA